ncbi:dicarboxylate transporter/tellurite-resistance protein TehA [Ancylobacter sp. A5.8]|uniref:SLAC1 family transporter n=1 Tax=Ancylobacter gelatini TaxID=2919920 RepID=UPI001F4D43AC|nr:dicarboxylate transporter/tellurite-resistance protein TehA [Ancylobacter gelatini]MCJ8141557.1 dicarboxylate transporter/tellurite-resistance protein TehA [Ancylobacter gelatini]
MRPMFFGSVLGIGGLANGWRVASRLWGVPVEIGEGLALLAFGLWALWCVLYAGKWLRYPQEARADLRHPVQALLAALIPVTTLIASMAIGPHVPLLGWVMFAAGVAGVVVFAAWSIGGLWQGGRDVAHTTAILYMPTVGGGLVAALACAWFGQTTLGWMYFGLGLISWMSMESVLLSRLFNHALPVDLRATMGVHLAPPAVACVAYLMLDPGPASPVALALFGYGCFLALVMIRLVPWLRQQPFGPGAWAYTFGVSALPLAALRLVEKGAGAPLAIMALPMFAVANLIIGWIAARSLVLVWRFVGDLSREA